MPADNTKKRSLTAAPRGSELLIEGSSEFQAKRTEMLARVCAKYAWVAQQGGYVLRKTPLKLQPYENWVFKKICAAEFGFHCTNEKGRTCHWHPGDEVDQPLAMYFEPKYFDGDNTPEPFVIAERIEFLPRRG